MKPIIFSTEMVQPILAERKTQTRRVIKGVSTEWDCFGRCTDGDSPFIGFGRGERLEKTIKVPYQPGDILWVRERFREFCGMFYSWNNGCYIPAFDFEGIEYFADGQMKRTDPGNWGEMFVMYEDTKTDIKHGKWRPSIHMPKKAARIFLRVTDVRVERVQDISEEDAWKEGCPDDVVPDKYPSSVVWFHELWNKLNLKRGYGWEANPWVYVIEFERISKDEINN